MFQIEKRSSNSHIFSKNRSQTMLIAMACIAAVWAAIVKYKKTIAQALSGMVLLLFILVYTLFIFVRGEDMDCDVKNPNTNQLKTA